MRSPRAQLEKGKYLGTGVGYPAGKGEVASNAEGNGAPEELFEKIRGLAADDRFSGPRDAMAALRGLSRIRTP